MEYEKKELILTFNRICKQVTQFQKLLRTDENSENVLEELTERDDEESNDLEGSIQKLRKVCAIIEKNFKRLELFNKARLEFMDVEFFKKITYFV
jgi:hypothetical protein